MTVQKKDGSCTLLVQRRRIPKVTAELRSSILELRNLGARALINCAPVRTAVVMHISLTRASQFTRLALRSVVIETLTSSYAAPHPFCRGHR